MRNDSRNCKCKTFLSLRFPAYSGGIRTERHRYEEEYILQPEVRGITGALMV